MAKTCQGELVLRTVSDCQDPGTQQGRVRCEHFSRYILLREASGKAVALQWYPSPHHRSSSFFSFLSFFVLVPGSKLKDNAEGDAVISLPVQPKRPRRVQRQRRRVFFSVFLCDVFQLFLVDVYVVFGGNRLAAQGAAVHLDVRLTRRNRHFTRLGTKVVRYPCMKGLDKNTRFAFICTYRNTLPLFRPPTADVSASLGRNVAVGPPRRWGKKRMRAHSASFSGGPNI